MSNSDTASVSLHQYISPLARRFPLRRTTARLPGMRSSRVAMPTAATVEAGKLAHPSTGGHQTVTAGTDVRKASDATPGGAPPGLPAVTPIDDEYPPECDSCGRRLPCRHCFIGGRDDY